MSEPTKSVVLLSGGLDSTTLLVERLRAGREVLPISFHYMQRHSHELLAAHDICAYYNLKTKIVAVPALNDVAFGSSSQLGGGPDVPHGHYADESMKVTVVPNRNMVMLSLAVAYAISRGAAEVCYAAHAGDHAIYPDCRPQFVEAVRFAIALCDYPTRTPVLYTPFINMSKAQIVEMGVRLDVPYDLTWSCYDPKPAEKKYSPRHGGYPDRFLHCGKCGTCVERREAFQLAGVVDPTEYEMQAGV